MLTKDDVREAVHLELAPLREEMRLLKHHITGNGTPSQGMIVRIDRLEQDNARLKWFVGIGLVPVVSAVVASVFALFR